MSYLVNLYFLLWSSLCQKKRDVWGHNKLAEVFRRSRAVSCQNPIFGPNTVFRFDQLQKGTSRKKGFSPGCPTGTSKAGLKPLLFSPGCSQTGTKGPPRGPGHVQKAGGPFNPGWWLQLGLKGSDKIFGIIIEKSPNFFWIFLISIFSNIWIV
jgi:hypothetical protein